MSELLLLAGWALLACATALLWAAMSRRSRLRRYLGTKRCGDTTGAALVEALERARGG